MATGGRTPIQPVILSGGAGTRLWPLSRADFPKQFLHLGGERTLLQETALRVSDRARFLTPVVVCNDAHRFAVLEQLDEVGVDPAQVIVEPVARNTAPAVALAALSVEPDTLIFVMPSDHVVRKRQALRNALAKGARAALEGHLVTFGIRPTRPETGYGYIRQGAPLEQVEGVHAVAEFVEKPDRTAAQLFANSGTHLWNSGMFVMRAGDYLDELRRHQPRIHRACRAAIENGETDLAFFRPETDAFAASPAKSIDYAVMELTNRAAVVPSDFGWSDVGSFDALRELGRQDRSGNVTRGAVVLEDVQNSYVHSEGPLIAASDLSDVVLIATDDAVMALPRARAQDVGGLLKKVRRTGGTLAESQTLVHRPWGSYQVIDAGDGFKVKRLTIKPGRALSLQRHVHRAEHWVVVSGTARVTRESETFDLGPNQSTYIPAGTVHRLENPYDEPLRVIEVQSGGYLEEDDIERIDDHWNRS